MIDEHGRALYAIITFLIELEEERFSDPLSEAMDQFNNHMSRLNGTDGILYNKHGDVLMKC